MDIEFHRNGSIIGDTYHMYINGNEIDLGRIISKNDSIDIFVRYIKETYNIDYDRGSIDFKWGGRL